jgi:hypothetical protein
MGEQTNTLQLSNYNSNNYISPQTPWQTITHKIVDYTCTEHRYIEVENYEIRLFTHEEGLDTPVFDSLYFRISLKEFRYTETGTKSETDNYPAIITTDSTPLTNTYIQYAGSVFKPTWTHNLYAIVTTIPHKFILLRSDVKSLYYCDAPSYYNPCSPVGVYATLLDDTTVYVLRAPNDKWLYFRPPTNITLTGDNDFDKFKSLWYINPHGNGYPTAPTILSQDGNTYIVGYCEEFTTNNGVAPPNSETGRMALAVTLGSVESTYIDTQSLTADDPENPTITGITGRCCNFKHADNSDAVYRGSCQELWDLIVSYNGEAWATANLLNMSECDCNERTCIDTGAVQEVE